MDEAIVALRDLVQRDEPGAPVGLYLTGSYCAGGLRPDSDLDVLLLTRSTLVPEERQALVDHLLRWSGRRAAVRPGRPVELTSLVLSDINPWRYPATRDLLYGEWLRCEYEAGELPGRTADPNLPVLLTSARDCSRVLFGPALGRLLEPVPPGDLVRGILDALPDLRAGLSGDERNVLLTLARMLFTVRTGRIVAKGEAADAVACWVGPSAGRVLDLAARAYRGQIQDDWTLLPVAAAATAAALSTRILDAAPG